MRENLDPQYFHEHKDDPEEWGLPESRKQGRNLAVGRNTFTGHSEVIPVHLSA